MTGISSGCVIGYKYFDFGDDFSSKTMEFSAKINGMGCRGRIRIRVDDDTEGEEIGCCEFGTDSGVIGAAVKSVTGRHSVFLIVEDSFGGRFVEMFSASLRI